MQAPLVELRQFDIDDTSTDRVAAPIVELNNVIPFARPSARATGPAPSAPDVAASERSVEVTPRQKRAALFTALLVGSFALHVALIALFSRAPPPLPGIELAPITVELIAEDGSRANTLPSVGETAAPKPVPDNDQPPQQETSRPPPEPQPEPQPETNQQPPQPVVPPDTNEQAPEPVAPPDTAEQMPQPVTPPLGPVEQRPVQPPEPASRAEAPAEPQQLEAPPPSPQPATATSPANGRPVETTPAEPKVAPTPPPKQQQPQQQTKPKQQQAPARESKRSPVQPPTSRANGKAPQSQPGGKPASSAPARQSSADPNYAGIVFARLARVKRMPADAQRNHSQGTATVSFVIDASGHVGGVRLVRGSGAASLDQEALALPGRASPFPPPPGGRSVPIKIPVSFHF